MGIIIDELRTFLERHVREHGIVVWFDAERHYEGIVERLQLTECHFLRYVDSYFRLREQAEPLIRGSQRPRVLVYVPLPWEDAQLPLAELIAFGESLRPGEKGLRNTKLAVVARRALKGVVPDARLEDLDRQIEKSQLSVNDLEEIATDSSSGLSTVLTVVFQTQYPEEAALSFLSSSAHDAELDAKNALPELLQIFQRDYGVLSSEVVSPEKTRDVLARHVLSTEFLDALGPDAPSALQALATAKEPTIARHCSQLAAAWRNRLDLSASYVDAAKRVERSLHLDTMTFEYAALARVRTFPATERQLIREVARRLAGGSSAEAEACALERRNSFWATRAPELQPEWDLILQAAQLLRLANEIDSAPDTKLDASQIAHAYTAGDNPWCLLDSFHRHIEKKANSAEFTLVDQPEELESLIVVARRRYAETAGHLAERFVRSLEAGQFELSGYYRQTQIFETAVAPQLPGKRVAYVLVDALRYELAREFVSLLNQEFEVTLDVVSGTMPGITPVGMAALLPGASRGLSIQATGKELIVVLDDHIMTNREKRLEYLRDAVDANVVVLKAEEPKEFKRKLKDLGDGSVLVVVTSREIDRAGEENLADARRIMEDVLTQLRLALRRLVESGVNYIIIATDHGYLFGDELSEAEKIDPPGGRTVLLHRRVWVGEGGAGSASYVRAPLSRFGVKSDLEVAVPLNLAAFRAPGSEAYFHGGLSPQEMLLPLIRLRPSARVAGSGTHVIRWDLKVGSAKITSLHFSVQVSGELEGLFQVEWPRIRLEVRAGTERCGIPVSAAYGFNDTTGEIALKAQEGHTSRAELNSITFMLTEKAPSRGKVSIHLLDAVTGVEFLKLQNVEVSRVF